MRRALRTGLALGAALGLTLDPLSPRALHPIARADKPGSPQRAGKEHQPDEEARARGASAQDLQAKARWQERLERAVDRVREGAFADGVDLAEQAAAAVIGTAMRQSQAQAWFLAGEARYLGCASLGGSPRRRCAEQASALFERAMRTYLPMDSNPRITAALRPEDRETPHPDLLKEHLRKTREWAEDRILKLQIEGDGEGDVTLQPPTMQRDPAAPSGARVYEAAGRRGTPVVLSARPANGSAPIGCAGSGVTWDARSARCQVVLAEDTVIVLRFARLLSFSLRMEGGGAGALRARVRPAGGAALEAVTRCERTPCVLGGIPSGSVLVVEALPSAASRFAGFTAGLCRGPARCESTLSQDGAVTARFTQVLHKQWWLWTSVALAAGAIAGGVGGGYHLYRRHHPEQPTTPPVTVQCPTPLMAPCAP